MLTHHNIAQGKGKENRFYFDAQWQGPWKVCQMEILWQPFLIITICHRIALHRKPHVQSTRLSSPCLAATSNAPDCQPPELLEARHSSMVAAAIAMGRGKAAGRWGSCTVTLGCCPHLWPARHLLLLLIQGLQAVDRDHQPGQALLFPPTLGCFKNKYMVNCCKCIFSS